MNPSFSFTADSVAYGICFSLLTYLALIPVFVKSSRIDLIIFIVVSIFSFIFYTSMGRLTTDQYMYVSEFHSLGKFDTFPWGHGFYWLLRAIDIFSNSSQAYVYGTAVFAIFLYGIAIYMNVPRNYRSLCLLIFVMHFDFFDLVTNVYRQCVASAFVLIAFHFLKNKNFVLFLLASLLASSFHWSATIVFFVLVAGYMTRNAPRAVLICASGSLIAGIFAVVTSSGLALDADSFKGLGGLFQALGNVKLDDKLNSYVGGGLDSAHFSDLGLAGRAKYLIDISLALAAIIYEIVKRNNFQLKSDDVQLFSTYSLLTIYNILFLGMAWFFRNSYWSFVFLPILIINICHRHYFITGARSRINIFLFICLYVGFSMFTMWRSPILSFNLLKFPV